MAKTNFTSVDQYLAAQPAATRRVLTRVRDTIRKALPGAQETISYQLPTYKLNGRAVIYFAAWTHHYSIYPSTRAVVDALKDELEPYEVEKGTIRFPLTGRVPVRLIAGIAKIRAREAAGRAQKSRSS
jgi:uncharacterized protein YdhG (YjbR/CyaY superfamily)